MVLADADETHEKPADSGERRWDKPGSPRVHCYLYFGL